MITISYRRIDSTPEARTIKGVIDFLFDKNEFKKTSHNILVLIIGPHWLSGSDAHENRLIDRPNDGVRVAIEKAISEKTQIIPIIINNASIPEKDELPDSINSICDLKYFPIRNISWKYDIIEITEKLKTFFHSDITITEEQIPSFSKQVKLEIANDEFEEKLLSLPHWKLIQEKNLVKPKQYLFREFKFQTFNKAIKFINIASVYIDKVNHHPTFENTYSSVSIKLSTHDIGNKVSNKDFDVAEYLENLYTCCFNISK